MDRVITARGLVDRMPRGALGMLMLPLAAGAEVKPGDYITVDKMPPRSRTSFRPEFTGG